MAPQTDEKYRVLQVLTRLASKDTHAGAAADLEKIVRVSERAQGGAGGRGRRD